MKLAPTIRYAAVAVSLFAGTRSARAHALGAECKVRGNQVVVEAYFSDNTAAQDARVSVRDAANREIASGKTDSDGRWSFPVPPTGRYEVVVDAGLGHRKAVSLTIDSPSKATPASSNQSQAPVSDGPTRTEFTRWPLERIACGLVLIASASIVLRWWLRRNAGSKAQNLDRKSSPITMESQKN
jgi:carboxypeptidase family protein